MNRALGVELMLAASHCSREIEGPPAHVWRLRHPVTSKLQTLGLIEKTQDGADRRRISLAITEKGKALLRKLAPYQREINDVEFGPLSREDFQTISRILEALIDSNDKAFALQR